MILDRQQIIDAVKMIKPALSKDNDYYVNNGYIIAQGFEVIAKIKVEGVNENFRLPAKVIPLVSVMGAEVEAKISAGTISFKSGKSRASYKITNIPEGVFDNKNFKEKHKIVINSDIVNSAVSKLSNIEYYETCTYRITYEC